MSYYSADKQGLCIPKARMTSLVMYASCESLAE
jgi:hypothetical protein